jgi:hypothetical protein
VLRAWLPDEVGEVTDVRIEWAPRPQRDYLDDRTSFDAFVDYLDTDGKLSFLGVETKLTEPFTATGGYNSKPSYQRLTTKVGSPWRPDTLEALGDATWCQLWRDHLLVEALRQRVPRYAGRGRLLVIHHQRDAGCVNAFNGYQQLLEERSTHDILKMPIDKLVAGLKTAVSLSELGWVEAFDRRYGDLSESQHLIEMT